MPDGIRWQESFAYLIWAFVPLAPPLTDKLNEMMDVSNTRSLAQDHPFFVLAMAVIKLAVVLGISKFVKEYFHSGNSPKDMQRGEVQLRAEAVRRFIEQKRSAVGKALGTPEHFQLHVEIPVYFKVDTEDGLTFSLVEGANFAAAKPIAAVTITSHYLSISVTEPSIFGWATSHKVLFDRSTKDREQKLVNSMAVDDLGKIHLFVDPQTFKDIHDVSGATIGLMPIEFHANSDLNAQSSLNPMQLDQTARLIVKSQSGESRDLLILLEGRVSVADALERAGLSSIYRKNEKGDKFTLDDVVEPGSVTLLYIPAIRFIYPQEGDNPPQQTHLELEVPVTMKDLILVYYMEWLSDTSIELRTESGNLVEMPNESTNGAIIQPGTTLVGHWRSKRM